MHENVVGARRLGITSHQFLGGAGLHRAIDDFARSRA
jgi:putative hydrolase of the HAD superfamily